MLSLLPCFKLVKVFSDIVATMRVAVVKFYSYNSRKILSFSTENQAANLIAWVYWYWEYVELSAYEF